MKYHACLGFNKLNRWIIPKDRVEDFEQSFYENRNLTDWDAYKTAVWAWNDTDDQFGKFQNRGDTWEKCLGAFPE